MAKQDSSVAGRGWRLVELSMVAATHGHAERGAGGPGDPLTCLTSPGEQLTKLRLSLRLKLFILVGLALALVLGCGGADSSEGGAPEGTHHRAAVQAETAYSIAADYSAIDSLEVIVRQLGLDVPCRGLESIRPEVFGQVWTILGDATRAELWEYVMYYFQVIGTPTDVERLADFLSNGYKGNLVAARDGQAAFRGLNTAPAAIGLLGDRLREEGNVEASERALAALVDCSSPAYWRGPAVSWRIESEVSMRPPFEEVMASYCILGMKWFSDAAAVAKLEGRQAAMAASGALTPHLAEAFEAAKRFSYRRQQAGGSLKILERLPACPSL